MDWQLKDNHHLEREFTFPDFAQALAFVNKVGQIADELDHHPDVYLSWGKVRLEIWTHTKNGVTPKDYDFASRVDTISG